MAHEEHFALLKQGVDAWNAWRSDRPEVKPNFSTAHLTDAVLRRANLRGADLSGADLMGADLTGAILTDADLSGAILSGAILSEAVLNGADLLGAIMSGAVLNGAIAMEVNLSGAILTNAVLSDAVLRRADLVGADLTGANLSGANLIGAKLNGADLMGTDFSRAYLMTVSLTDAVLSEADLTKAHLSSADLTRTNFTNAILNEADLSGANLSEANLSGADLSNADLKGANLNSADLKGTNLSEANLCVTQALNANFYKAIFTGACIEDWQTNSATNLDLTVCDYVYLHGREERCPSSGNFAPGDFTKRFQKALDKVDLFFHHGINWVAFAYALKVEAEAEGVPLRINTIEELDDGTVLVRLKIPLEANKDKIQAELRQKHETFHKALEERYQITIKDNKEQINQLLDIVNQQSLVQKVIAADDSDIFISNDNVSILSDEIDTKTVQAPSKLGSLQAYAHNQNLTEAAAEIRQLLKQLQQTYPSNTPLEKQILVTVAIRRIEGNPILKLRVLEALQVAGIDAFKELVDRPLANILLAALEGWQIE